MTPLKLRPAGRPIKMDRWSVTFGETYSDGFVAPEQQHPRLQGLAERHPHKPERVGSQKVLTSPIKAVDGRFVTTYNGTVYELGEPDPKYVEWLVAEGRPPIDPAHPIKVIG